MGQMNNNRPVMATTPGATYGSSSGQAVSPFQVSQMTPTVAQTPQTYTPPSSATPTAPTVNPYITDRAGGFNTYSSNQVTLFNSPNANPKMYKTMQTAARFSGESAESLANMIGYSKIANPNVIGGFNYAPVWQNGSGS